MKRCIIKSKRKLVTRGEKLIVPPWMCCNSYTVRYKRCCFHDPQMQQQMESRRGWMLQSVDKKAAAPAPQCTQGPLSSTSDILLESCKTERLPEHHPRNNSQAASPGPSGNISRFWEGGRLINANILSLYKLFFSVKLLLVSIPTVFNEQVREVVTG